MLKTEYKQNETTSNTLLNLELLKPLTRQSHNAATKTKCGTKYSKSMVYSRTSVTMVEGMKRNVAYSKCVVFSEL